MFAALMLLLGWGVVHGAQAMPYRWQWQRVPPYIFKVFDGHLYPGPLMQGLFVTLQISALAFLATLAAGLVAALLRLSGSPVGRALARCYIEVTRNTPLLVQLYVFYFVLAPILGIGRMTTGVLALGLFEGAFAAEIIRAGIQAVPAGQAEAAASLGLTQWQALRIVLPPLASLMISLVKHSAIVSAIAIFDLANEARNVISDTFMTFEIWLTVAGMYLVVTILLSLGARWLDYRLSRASAA